MRKAKFHMDGKNYSFDPHGDLNAEYDIILWNQTSESLDVHDIVAHYSILQSSLTFISQEARDAVYIYIVSITSIHFFHFLNIHIIYSQCWQDYHIDQLVGHPSAMLN